MIGGEMLTQRTERNSMFAIKYNFRQVGEPIEDCEREDEGVGSIPGGSAWSKLRRER